MSNQHQHWNQIHSDSDILNEATGFSQEVLALLSAQSNILELGCGAGTDAASFALKGHSVIATDFSEIVIEKNRKRYINIPNLIFKVLDTGKAFNFKSENFDMVYARLSLHYFSDQETRTIFRKVHNILKMDGYFCFMCKSTKDPLFGQGTEIEKNMYENKGHIRHFFSKSYVLDLLNNKYEVISLSENKEKLYGSDSEFIKVIAKKKKL